MFAVKKCTLFITYQFSTIVITFYIAPGLAAKISIVKQMLDFWHFRETLCWALTLHYAAELIAVYPPSFSEDCQNGLGGKEHWILLPFLLHVMSASEERKSSST